MRMQTYPLPTFCIEAVHSLDLSKNPKDFRKSTMSLAKRPDSLEQSDERMEVLFVVLQVFASHPLWPGGWECKDCDWCLSGCVLNLRNSVEKQENNFAFIDAQNLHLSIHSLGWKLDLARFRVYLKEKYHVTQAFMFIGYMEGNSDLYTVLQRMGYICIFKPTLRYKDGKTKGNCDAELVLQAMIELPSYSKAVLVTGDGDFHCLVKYLIEQEKLEKLLVPNKDKYFALLKRFDSQFLAFVSDLRHKMEYKKRTP